MALLNFLGFRVHLPLHWHGVITGPSVAPANAHDLSVVLELSEGTPSTLLGNRNYWRNSSELRGNQQPAAFQEGIEAPGPPGPKERCKGHLAAGAAADFTAGHQQVAQAPFRSVVIRGSLRVGNEDEQLLDVPLNPPAQFSPDGRSSRKGGHSPSSRLSSVNCSREEQPPGRRPFPAFGVKPLHSQCPLGQPAVFWVQDLQRVNVPQQSLPPTPIGSGPNTSV